MLIKRTLSLLFCIWFGTLHCFNADEQFNLGEKPIEEIETACMALWTQLDLARAISLTAEQKTAFISDLAEQVVDLYCLIKSFRPKPQRTPSNQEYIASLNSTIQAIAQSLPEVFEEVTAPAFTTSQFLLDRIATLLINL